MGMVGMEAIVAQAPPGEVIVDCQQCGNVYFL